MEIELTVLRDTVGDGLPGDADFHRWAGAALVDDDGAGSLTIRLVGADESRRLNREYRGRDNPTNVLSFAADLPSELIDELGYRPLGDLAICPQVVHTEAGEQGKSVADHWAHLVVHGILHLRGLDHADEQSAKRMEALEKRILQGLGIPDPYRPR